MDYLESDQATGCLGVVFGLTLFTCFGPVTLPLTLLCGAFTGLYL